MQLSIRKIGPGPHTWCVCNVIRLAHAETCVFKQLTLVAEHFLNFHSSVYYGIYFESTFCK